MLHQTTTVALAISTFAFAITPATDVARPAHAPPPSGRAAVLSPARVLDDATIVAIFDAANTADIETGKLAAVRGKSSEVRAFGAMLAHDHEQVRQMGRDLAQKLGVTPTPPADDPGARAHESAMTKLRALSGAEFDHAFLVHEEAFHASVIEAITSTLLPAIRNAELKALVTKVAPAFEAHRRAAVDMEKRLGSQAAR
ncbi:MAG: DUF4142 domain-containing protein [Gemmatimonadota bacterium]